MNKHTQTKGRLFHSELYYVILENTFRFITTLKSFFVQLYRRETPIIVEYNGTKESQDCFCVQSIPNTYFHQTHLFYRIIKVQLNLS